MDIGCDVETVVNHDLENVESWEIFVDKYSTCQKCGQQNDLFKNNTLSPYCSKCISRKVIELDQPQPYAFLKELRQYKIDSRRGFQIY